MTPGALRLDQSPTSGIALIWAAFSGATGTVHYQLKRAPDVSGVPGTFTNIGSSQTTLTYVDATAAGDMTKVWYKVEGTDDLGTAETLGVFARFYNADSDTPPAYNGALTRTSGDFQSFSSNAYSSVNSLAMATLPQTDVVTSLGAGDQSVRFRFKHDSGGTKFSVARLRVDNATAANNVYAYVLNGGQTVFGKAVGGSGTDLVTRVGVSLPEGSYYDLSFESQGDAYSVSIQLQDGTWAQTDGSTSSTKVYLIDHVTVSDVSTSNTYAGVTLYGDVHSPHVDDIVFARTGETIPGGGGGDVTIPDPFFYLSDLSSSAVQTGTGTFTQTRDIAGTFYGQRTIVPAFPSGKSLKFVNEYITFTMPDEALTGITFALTIKPIAFGGVGQMIGVGGAVGLSFQMTPTVLYLYHSDGPDIQIVHDFVAGTEYRIILGFNDAGDAVALINGATVLATTGGAGLIGSLGALGTINAISIGDSGGNKVDGWYQDIRIYTTMLSEAQMQALDATLNPAATTYLIDSTDGWATAGVPVRITLTPDGHLTGNIVLTPSGCGLSTPQTLTLSAAWEAPVFEFIPLSAGTLTITGTNTAGLSNPSPLALTIASVDADGAVLFPVKKVISAPTALSFIAHHLSNVGGDPVTLEFSFDDFATVFATETTPRPNTFASNASTRGVKYASLPYHTLDIAPSDFGSSGVKTLAWRVVAADGSVTRMPDTTIFVNKGDVAGEAHTLSSGTFDTAVSGFSNTNHGTLSLGANVQSWTSSATVTQNATGYLYVEGAGRVVADNGDGTGHSPFPNLTWLKGLQLGDGGTTPPYVTVRGSGDFGSYFVEEEVLHQGPIGAYGDSTYHGANWSTDVELTISATVFALNSSYIGVGTPKTNLVSVGCLTEWSVWGDRSVVDVMCDYRHILKPANADLRPTPLPDNVDGVHDDVKYLYGGGHARMYIADCDASETGGTRGFVFAGDGPIDDFLTLQRCYIGDPVVGQQAALFAVSTVTILEEVAVTGAFGWYGATGDLPYRAHNSNFRPIPNGPLVNPTLIPNFNGGGADTNNASGYATWDDGGKFILPKAHTDGSLTVELAYNPAHSVSIDATKFSLTGCLASVTGASLSNGVVTLTTDVPVYADETPTLVMASGAATVNGVPSEAQTTSVWRNRSAVSNAAPAGVTHLVAHASNNHVRLTWTNSVDGGTYAIQRGITNVFADAADLAFDQPPGGYTDTTAVNGTTYYYWVITIGDTSDSDPVGPVSATPAEGGGDLPAGNFSTSFGSNFLDEFISNFN